MLSGMPKPELIRVNGREKLAGAAIAASAVSAMAIGVLVFHFHPAILIFGISVGPSLGIMQSQRMARRRLALGPQARTTSTAGTR